MAKFGIVKQYSEGSGRVLGIRIDWATLDTAVAQLSTWIAERARGQYVTLTNVHMVVEAHKYPDFRSVLREASLCLPDGMPLVWLARIRGCIAERLSGPDFMLEFCRRTVGLGYRHFFYGGAPSVAERLAKTLQQQFSGMQIAGIYSPPFRELTPEEDAQVIDYINATNPDIIWVGLGCPKQERWMHSHRHLVSAPVMLGVGQAFDVHTGRLPRAPLWMRNCGLEWFFRLCIEPRRLWRRYLFTNASFLAWLFAETVGLKHFD